MDLRNWPDSHALDDVSSICSFDDDHIDVDVGSLTAAELCKQGERTPVVDAYAFVGDAKAARKLSKSKKTLSAASKQSAVPTSTAAPLAVAAPSKPLKWQLRLADRATAGVQLEAYYQLPPHVLFDLLADPMQHERIFDEIVSASAELLEDEGPRRKWRLDYKAKWAFWKVSGVCENRLWMWTDRDHGTVTFKLREPGFLRRYEGTWTIKPACGTSMSECYAAVAAAAAPAGDVSSSEYSSSAGSSSASSRSGSPLRGAQPGSGMRDLSSISGRAGLRGLLAPLGSSGRDDDGDEVYGSGSTAGGMLRVTPLASVNLTLPGVPAAAGAGNSSGSSNAGRPSSPAPLMGAVAAIYRMQEAVQQRINSGVASFTSFGSSTAAMPSGSSGGGSFLGGLGNRIGGMLPQLPNDVGQAVQGNLGRVSPPWSGLLPDNDTGSSGGGGGEGKSDQRQQQRQLRRPVPTAAIIIADCLTSPSVTPPYPLNQILKTQSKGQVQEMLDGLVKAAVAAANAAGAAQQAL